MNSGIIPLQTWIRSICDRNHDAVMRIGGEAQGGEPILHFGVEAMCQVGSPPPRIGIEATRLHPHRLQMILDHLLGQAAGRRATPCGISPVVTIRHSATSSLRANATIIVLRVPPRLSCVRAWYHCARALSFWNMRKRHAS